AHVNAPIPSVSSGTGLPHELDAVFEHALAKDPARRYRTSAEFVAALRAAFADAAGSTRRMSTVPLAPPRPALSPRPVWPLLVAAVQKHQGTRSLDEAYADFNLAYTRFHLGNCDGVLQLLDRSESIQGRRNEIDRLRHDAEKTC